MRKALATALLLAAAGALECRTEVLDRVAVSVSNSVITLRDVMRELKVTALLSRTALDLSPEARRRAADRLVERALILREMSFSKYPQPDPDEIRSLASQFRTANFPSEAACKQELERLGITWQDVEQQFGNQLMLLSFIEVRFRPSVQVPARDIENYYSRQFLPEWKKLHGDSPAPTLDQSRPQIEQILTQALVDRALDRWLGESRTQTRIRYRDEVFR